MTDTPPGAGHNLAADRLRSLVDRHERLTEEIAGLRSDQSDIVKEAVSAGFDRKALMAVIKLRKMEPAAREELENLVDVYMRALGE